MFNTGSGFNDIVRTIALQTNKILVGGDFTTYSGDTANRIIRLNSDGSIDNTIEPVSTTIILSTDILRLWEKIEYIQGVTPTDIEVAEQLQDIQKNILIENPIDTQD